MLQRTWIEPDRFTVVSDRAVIIALGTVGASAIVVGDCILGIEPDGLAVFGDGAVVITLGAVSEAAGEGVLWIERDRISRDSAVGFAFQNVLYILAPSHLRIGGLKAVLQFAFTYE